jgi:hypothetical protein
MLVVFLFNVGGYFLAFWAFEYKLNRDLTTRLDKNLYSEEETFSIKIPVALPYPIQQQDFERVDGKFEYNGEFYKLVKHKLENDTLFIVCIKNHEQKQLVKTMTSYIKLSNDIAGTGKKALSFLSKLLKDFDTSLGISIETHSATSDPISYGEFSTNVITRTIPIHAPPPEA